VIRFLFDEKKALEALVLVASEWPGISPFYASKVFFLAEKQHLNQFGRPVVGDRYIAMRDGPVPSALYDWFKGNFELTEDPGAVTDALEFNRNGRQTTVTARREPDLEYLSASDLEALRSALAFCRGKAFNWLSASTHRDQAWLNTPLNCEMDPRLMIEGPQREQVIEEAEEFAQYGVA